LVVGAERSTMFVPIVKLMILGIGGVGGLTITMLPEKEWTVQ
jgi:tRNA A37 threonylcarbamoyladenosine dehydratase